MLSEIEKVWLACAIDCDGHVGMKLSKQKQKGKIYEYVVPQLGFSNTHQPLTSRFGELIDMNIFPSPYSDKIIHRVAMHNTQKIHDILIQIITYMIAKRKRAEYVLAFCKHKLASPGHHGKGRSPRLDEDLKWLEEYRGLFPSHRRNRTEDPP